jgi:hypothetical protein
MNPVPLHKLNHVFSRHAGDFGITGQWNATNAALLEQALRHHINDPHVQTIAGTYRGVQHVTHFYNPSTNLNVMVDLSDDLVSGWKLSATYLLTTGNVQ